MHIPKIFEQNNQEISRQLINEYPLATVIFQLDDGIDIHHLPLLWLTENGCNKLVGHVAVANKIWQQKIICATAIFQSAEQFISASWYASKKEDGKVVPTWNYDVVHVSGKVAFYHNDTIKRQYIELLTNYMETGLQKSKHNENKQQREWQINDAPDTFIEKMLKATVAFDIGIDKVEAKRKTSQNQKQENKESVIDGLQQLDNTEKMQALIKGV